MSALRETSRPKNGAFHAQQRANPLLQKLRQLVVFVTRSTISAREGDAHALIMIPRARRKKRSVRNRPFKSASGAWPARSGIVLQADPARRRCA